MKKATRKQAKRVSGTPQKRLDINKYKHISEEYRQYVIGLVGLLQYARHTLGKSFKVIAEKAGMSEPGVYNIATGRCVFPRPTTINNLLVACGQKPLFTAADIKKFPNAQRLKVLEGGKGKAAA